MCKKVLEKLFNSKEFKESHESAQLVLKENLLDLDKQGFLQDSDFTNLVMLTCSMDLFFRMRDCLKQDNSFSYRNTKGQIVVSPLISPLAAQQRCIFSILDGLGGSTKSRRRLNQKDLKAAELSPLDNLLNEESEEKFDDEAY